MADVILCDPLGRNITLHDRTWYGHILRGHAEMEPFRNEVEMAVITPDEIRMSKLDKSYRQYYSSEYDSGLRFMVVVDVDLQLVKTAHHTKKIKGGAVEWSRQML